MFVLALTLALYALTSTAADLDSARQHYDSGKFEVALSQLQELPQRDAAYYYNLGNAYYRLNRFGLSTAHYEKALSLAPNDRDIRFNLEISRRELGKQIGTDSIDPASNQFELLTALVPPALVKGIVGLLLLFAAGAFVSFRRTNNKPHGITALSTIVVALALSSVYLWGTRHPSSVCLQSLTVRSGPGEHFLELAKRETGSKVRLLGPSAKDKADNIWLQVRYTKNHIGWLPQSQLLTLL